METTTLVTSPNIEGNIGSCEVKKVEFKRDYFHTQVVATNSCTGEIITENVYFDWSIVMILILFVGVAGFISGHFDKKNRSSW